MAVYRSTVLLLAVTVSLTGFFTSGSNASPASINEFNRPEISAVVALVAWWPSSDRRGDGITLWDISGAYALTGYAAGMLSDLRQVLEF
jgi:hypothetical protein